MKQSKQTAPQVYRGIGIGAGGVDGVLRFFRRRGMTERKIGAYRGKDGEMLRLRHALEEVGGRLNVLVQRTVREIGQKEAQIFEIHAMLLEDADFLETLEEEIGAGSCAEQAVTHASEKYAAILMELSDPYLRARAADLRDVARQIIAALSEEEEPMHAEEGTPYILVADDLAPSETVTLDKNRLLGFVTFTGTPNSHTSILARAMGIPALVGVGEIDDAQDGAYALLSAADGMLTVSPTDAQKQAFQARMKETNALAQEHERYLRSLIHKPAITRGGHRMLIYANVGGRDEAESARLNGADGIGLLRSEFLYLAEKDYPSEEALYRSYCEIVSQLQGKRIVIRTLDIGADKQISYFSLPKEENPALGFRGVRICLAREELFKTQLRAILRASAHGSISVMIPMIVSVEEVRACRQLLEECKEELRKRKQGFDEGLEFGIMIETPAAAIMCEELAEEVDFFSVGTNDLLQYTLAADRQNPAVSRLCEENTEPVLRMIRAASEAIHRHGGWIGICGELAADLHLTQRFADMRIDELSVSVPYLLGVRERVIECK
ncbi:MAG: phosphoenolpyruvate--protein phosphotransferase [Clostridia bacterium]|nr:phosphoenolpyruvate--protein phosphotransferase [Clostridia bacterium]MBQ9774271.1 phosphoenolpyruvate--protein phosphotransferase [Clostridia bacterium]